MPDQINVNIRMDREIKEQADALFSSLGFNLTTAVNAFVRQAIREQAIPFQIRAKTAEEKYDEYFNSHNMKILLESIADLKAGKGIVKTMDELEAMAE